MKFNKKWTTGFFGVTILAVGLELWAIFDGSDNTTPWTSYFINFFPWYIGMPIVVGFAAWLVHHFGYWYKVKNAVTSK